MWTPYGLKPRDLPCLQCTAPLGEEQEVEWVPAGPGYMHNSQDEVTRLVLHGAPGAKRGYRGGEMLGPPPSSSTDEVRLQGAAGGVVLEEGALGQRPVGSLG